MSLLEKLQLLLFLTEESELILQSHCVKVPTDSDDTAFYSTECVLLF